MVLHPGGGNPPESRRGVGLPRPGLTIHRFWAGQAHAPTGFPLKDGEPMLLHIAGAQIIETLYETVCAILHNTITICTKQPGDKTLGSRVYN